MTQDLFIYSEPTPNPATLKFMIGRQIVDKTFDFVKKEDAEKQSPLAFKLFGVEDITGVYLGRTFVTVSKKGIKHWDDYEDEIIGILEEHLKTDEPVVNAKAESTDEIKNREVTDTEKAILDILDDEIRPAVAMDGGDIIFKSYEDGIVYLQMIGACAGCPSSTATLKMGIETRLREAIPEVQEVVAV